MSLAAKYNKSLEKHWCMRFKTIHPDGDSFDGVVTHNRRRFIALGQEIDFQFDGMVVLPKGVIKGYRDDKYEQCCNRIIRTNGSLKRFKPPPWIEKCDTIREVVAQIQMRKIWPCVEILIRKGKDTALYLGPIVELRDIGFVLKCYDAAGVWEKPYELEFNEIFMLKFGDRYSNHFNRYMRSR